MDPEDQVQIDDAVTTLCNCPQAKSEMRKIESARKIEEFIRDNVEPQAKHIVEEATTAVRAFDISRAQILTNDGWTINIEIDKDGYTAFKCKKVSSHKEKF